LTIEPDTKEREGHSSTGTRTPIRTLRVNAVTDNCPQLSASGALTSQTESGRSGLLAALLALLEAVEEEGGRGRRRSSGGGTHGTTEHQLRRMFSSLAG
jgi:hypothetical protein